MKMTNTEKRAVISLSTIMSLRMIGLFMALPVFSVYALQLPEATPTLIGLATGIYGLTQAFFQIPFGHLSDHFGRKPIIFFGLLIFILGSLLCGFAQSIYTVIVGRGLQGAGAVGSTILAMMADLTREEKRTISMAVVGMTIGISFAIAMILGPSLAPLVSLSGLFFIAALFGLLAIILLLTLTPTPIAIRWHRDTEPEFKSFFKLLISAELAKLNIGIFLLHTVFTASFVVIPIYLNRFAILPPTDQWKIYLPSLIIAFIFSFFCITHAERKHQLKLYFLGSIIALSIAEFILWASPTNKLFIFLGLCLFFSGFSTLEAFLPSLMSRTAPLARKGSALGLYSCAQFLGIFVGGLSGGWLYGQFGSSIVFLFCICLILFWLMLAYFMRAPRYLVTQIWQLSPHHQIHLEVFMEQLKIAPGVIEVSFVNEDNTIYLRVDPNSLHHPDFIRLKEQLQS